MTKQEEIAALREEIKKKERQLYRANKDMNAWNKGMAKGHSNAKNFQLFAETQRREIGDLQLQLSKLEGHI